MILASSHTYVVWRDDQELFFEVGCRLWKWNGKALANFHDQANVSRLEIDVYEFTTTWLEPNTENWADDERI